MTHGIHAHVICLVLFTCLVASQRHVEYEAEDFIHEREEYFRRDPQAPGVLIHDETVYINGNISKNTAHVLPSASRGSAQLPQIFRVPWWASFIGSLIHFFYRQRVPNRSQFGVIYMANVNNLNQFPLYFIPQTPNGHPIINNTNLYSPPNANNFNNYVAARPMEVGQTMVHAERTLLSQLDALWDSYVRFYGFAPNIIVLYSWIMPCPNCTNMIVQYLTQPRYANVEYRVVAYTAEGTSAQANLPYMTPEGNRRSRALLLANNILYWRQRCDRPPGARSAANVPTKIADLQGPSNSPASASDTPCRLTDTLQGCLVDCLGHDFCCTCKESSKKSMVVAMVNNLTKDCGTSDLEVCATSWIQNALSGPRSGASSCAVSAQQKITSCVKKCVGRPLSKPLNPKRPTLHPGILSQYSDIFHIASVNLTGFCQDARTEGVLCNRFSSDSFTAGNTLCRNGSRCDFQGYPYKWCYVDFNDAWDYCCTSPCGFAQNTNYMWCESGSRWQHCGDAGTVTVEKQQCLSEYPCGMHQERGGADFYWCYIDAVRSWEHCCQPQDTCSKKGETYDWCWTGKENGTVWMYCQP